MPSDDYLGAYSLFQRPLGEGQAREPRLDRIGGGNVADSSGFNYGSMLSDPMAYLALLGTGLGVGSNIYSGIQQQQHYNQLLKQAQQPFNWQQYYNPATALEQAELTRALKGDLALRGVPQDSMAVSGAVAQLLARDALQRQQQAYGLAQGQQGNILQAMGSFRGAPAIGDVSALPQYLSMLKLMGVRQNEQANQANQFQSWQETLRRIFGGGEDKPGQLYQDLQYQQPATQAGGFQGDIPSASEDYWAGLDPNAYAQ